MGGDGGQRPADPPPDPPVITALSVYQASVGDPVTFIGENFVDPQFGFTDVVFTGIFEPSDGSPANQVDLTVPLQPGLRGELTWDSFGGYRVPFLPAGNKLGRFSGTVHAVNNYYDAEVGTIEQVAEPIDIEFYVNPSSDRLGNNRAFGDSFIADCVEPSTVVLQMMRYALRVKALGFDVARFEFVAAPGLIQADIATEKWVINTDPVIFGYEANGNDEFAIVHRWSPPPNVSNGYVGGITATARGVGMHKDVQFPFIVRPSAYPVFEGAPLVAELLDPQQVSGCIPGGPSSVQVSYEESVADTRSRSVSSSIDRSFGRSFDESFSETYSLSNPETFSETQSQSTTVGNTAEIGASTSLTDIFSETDTRTRSNTLSWNFDQSRSDTGVSTTTTIDDTRTDDLRNFALEGDAAGQVGGFPFTGGQTLVRLEVGADTGWNWGQARTVGTHIAQSNSQTNASSFGQGASFTDSESFATTRGQQIQQGRSWGFSRSFQQQIGLSLSRAIGRTETFGEALTTSQGVSESLGTTESEALTQSSTETVARKIDAWVWANQFGVWYRQTTRVIYRAAMIAHDFCGNGQMVGELNLSEWQWAPDLAIGDTCPPPSNLPPRECRIEPCTF